MKIPSTYGRKGISVSSENLVTVEPLYPESDLIRLIQPRVKGLSLAVWAATRREWIESLLITHGALLFRGFTSIDITEFERFTSVVAGELLEYRERSSPRSRIRGGIYTSTDYPSELSI